MEPAGGSSGARDGDDEGDARSLDAAGATLNRSTGSLPHALPAGTGCSAPGPALDSAGLPSAAARSVAERSAHTDAAQPPAAAETTATVGPWLISAARVSVRAGWVPADPLHTWHDTEPFRAPAEGAHADDEPPAAAPPPTAGKSGGGATASAAAAGNRRKGSNAK